MLILALILGIAVQAEAILKAHCSRCHGSPQAERGIDVFDPEGMVDAGVIEPGNPKSALLRVVENGRMPLKGKKLTHAEIDTLRRWVMEMRKSGPGLPGPVANPKR